MKLFKKEKRVVELFSAHVDMTEECLAAAANAIKEYLSGNTRSLATEANRVVALEKGADELLRDIRELLYSGAYLPLIRGDIYRLMSAVDQIANKVEDCLVFLNCQRPTIPQEYRAEFTEITDLTVNCFSEFRVALKAFFKPKGKVKKLRESTARVGEIESFIDNTERALTTHVFESQLQLNEKLHLRRFLARLIRVSDGIEDASQELDLVSLKSII